MGADVTRVLLLDGHHLFREGVGRIIAAAPDLVVAGAAATGREGVRLLEQLDGGVDVVVLDPALPDLDGLIIVRQIKARHPAVRVLLFAITAEDGRIGELIATGADGFLLKQASVEDLLAAIRAVARGDAALAPVVARRLLAQLGQTARLPRGALSAREREVLEHLAQGRTSKEIALALGRSVNTIDNHRARVLVKLGASNTAAAVRHAIHHGLLPAASWH